LEGLAELGFKPDKRLRDRITAGLQGGYRALPVGWRSLLEGYVEREEGIHVHFRKRRDHCGSGGFADPAEFCATFEWPDGPLFDDLKAITLERLRNFLGERPDGFLEAVEPDEAVDEVWSAVLVDVPQLVQYRELVAMRRALPATKRLQSLEVCAETWPDSPEVAALVASPLERAESDRESDTSPLAERSLARDRVSGGGATLHNGQFPDEVVERGSKVVDDVSNNESEPQGRWVAQGGSVDHDLPFRVHLGFEEISTVRDEMADGSFERANVYVRSLDPFQTGFVVLVQAVTSS
jgi:hypothetical protein